jgi:Flp pilus assembly pilin Flp
MTMANITDRIDETSLRAWVTTRSRMAELANRAKEEDGQSTAEYVGVVVLVVAILGAVIGNAETLGGALSRMVTRAITAIGDLFDA